MLVQPTSSHKMLSASGLCLYHAAVKHYRDPTASFSFMSAAEKQRTTGENWMSVQRKLNTCGEEFTNKIRRPL